MSVGDILEPLRVLAFVAISVLGLRKFERRWKEGLRRDAELEALLAIEEERRQRHPIVAFPGPPSAEGAVYDIGDEGRRLLREGRTKEVAERLARVIGRPE